MSNTNAGAKNYAAIPEPTTDNQSLRQSVSAMKETVEVHTGQRGNIEAAAVTWGDLVRLGIIDRVQVPRK